MQKLSNLHFPPELRFENSPSANLKQIFSQWKGLPYSEPDISPKTLCALDHEAQTRMLYKPGFRIPEFTYPSTSGLLYRIVLNEKFVRGVILSSLRSTLSFSKDLVLGMSSEVLTYGSVPSNDGIFYTSSTSSLENAVTCYGPGFHKHSEGRETVKYWFDLFGLIVTDRRVLLLAIDPKNNRLLTDPLGGGTFAIEGQIPIQNILILNDSPELLDKLLKTQDESSPTNLDADLVRKRLRSGLIPSSKG